MIWTFKIQLKYRLNSINYEKKVNYMQAIHFTNLFRTARDQGN